LPVDFQLLLGFLKLAMPLSKSENKASILDTMARWMGRSEFNNSFPNIFQMEVFNNPLL
jgi:hypothetical protein